VNACSADADCSDGEVCAPEGLRDARGCIPAACRTDADCGEAPGGRCTLLDLGCCAVAVGGGPARAPALVCAYPGDGCQADADCAGGASCVAREGRAVCSASCP
jgi:hypothetical protein